MDDKYKLKPKYKNFLRPFFGGIILFLGIIFMFVPFIPLGYIFVFGGLFLLSTEIPIFKNWLDKAKAKDKKNRIDKVEDTINKKEEKVAEKIIRRKD
jgi:hypothetical protein